MCGGNHANDQPWILYGVVDVSARWGRHKRYFGSIIGRGTNKFSLLYGSEARPGVKWTLRETGYSCLGSRLRISDSVSQFISRRAQ